MVCIVDADEYADVRTTAVPPALSFPSCRRTFLALQLPVLEL
jgi:hypothetical protein